MDRTWCGIYTRQSREPNDEFSSCQAQFDACFNFVRSQFGAGWICKGQRYDDEAESSENIDRPALQRLLSDVRAGKVDRVVVHRLDRFSRSLIHSATILSELRDLGVGFTVVTAPELGTNAEHMLILHIMSAFAEFEREMIRERMTEARKTLKQHGRRVAGVVPYGYVADSKTKQLVVERSEARRVQSMFRLAVTGKKPSENAEYFNRRGWPTKQRVSARTGKTTGGNRWTSRQVLATLANPVYAGFIRDGDELRTGAHEAIVDANVFDEVRTAVQSRRTRVPGTKWNLSGWLLRGLITCAGCGRLMNTQTSRHKNFLYRYYTCRSHAGGRKPCRGVSAPAFELEKHVIALLSTPGGCSPGGDTTDEEMGLFRSFAAVWSALPRDIQSELLPKVTKRVVFDARKKTIQVTIDTTLILDYSHSDFE